MQIFNFEAAVTQHLEAYLVAQGKSEDEVTATTVENITAVIEHARVLFDAARNPDTHPEIAKAGRWQPFFAKVWAETRQGLLDYYDANL